MTKSKKKTKMKKKQYRKLEKLIIKYNSLIKNLSKKDKEKIKQYVDKKGKRIRAGAAVTPNQTPAIKETGNTSEFSNKVNTKLNNENNTVKVEEKQHILANKDGSLSLTKVAAGAAAAGVGFELGSDIMGGAMMELVSTVLS